MKKINIFYLLTALVALATLTTSCEKYLDAKSQARSNIPSSVADLQGLLDNYNFMNTVSSGLGEQVSDNYYIPDVAYNMMRESLRNIYRMQPDLFAGLGASDWQNQYNTMYQANIVLDYLPKIERNVLNATDWDNCKGQALAFRAKSLWETAQIWAPAYDPAGAAGQLGIPLRLTSNFNVPNTRANLQETYAQIISDSKAALRLLPPKATVSIFRPSKVFVYGLLARTYLVMREFANAKLYADSALAINSQLVNYNTLPTSGTYPFSAQKYTNPEQYIYSTMNSNTLAQNYGVADGDLYNSFSADDIRKTLFKKFASTGLLYFAGGYNGASPGAGFNGIATDEMYLVRAECNARLNNVSAAMNDLNTLLITRFKTGTYVPLTAANSAEALAIALVERRKGLCYRGLRLSDIKRLNRENANITITHIVQGKAYQLLPNDPRAALQIPISAIQLGGIQQNPGW